MKDIEFDRQASSSLVSDLAPVQDWTFYAEELLQSLATDTTQLLEVVKNHFLKIGKTSRKIFNLAEETCESKQAQVFIKQNFNSALRKDLEKGRKLWNYTEQLDVEEDLRFILSGTGFDTGNAILGKLPDTLSKVEFPGVLEDPIAKRLNVAAGILSELVELTLKEKEGVEKNGVKSSDIARLIKLHSVPNCDRVEFKADHTTYRAEVIEYCPDTDVVKVRVDGSGEEKEIPRGTIALKEQKAPKLHEPCLVQGDEIEHYNKCGIFKALLNDDKALVLLLDGRLIEVPKKQIIKGKKGSPIPELLFLLDESGNADKVSLAEERAVERTSKKFEKRIDELTTEAGKAYDDGRISVAAEAREMEPKVSYEMFLEIPVEEKLEIFAVQPEEAKKLILANYVKSLPVENPVTKVELPVVEVINSPIVDVKVVEIETPVVEPVVEPVVIDMTRFARKDLTETLPTAPAPLGIEERLASAEIDHKQAVDVLEAKKGELGVKGSIQVSSHVVKSQCVVEIKAERTTEAKLRRLKNELKALTASTVVEPEPEPEPELAPNVEMVFSKEDITLADGLLTKGYRKIESAGTRVEHVLTEVEQGFPRFREYLTSSYGQEWLCLYYLKNPASLTAIVRLIVLDKKQADGIIERAIDRLGELQELTEYYRSGNKVALEKIDPRVKKISQLLLTKEEFLAIQARVASQPTKTTPTAQEPADVSRSISPKQKAMEEETEEISGGF